MRCFCCNTELTDYEATIKSKETTQYLDMCIKCIKEAGITSIIDRKDLCPTQMIDEEDMEEYEP